MDERMQITVLQLTLIKLEKKYDIPEEVIIETIKETFEGCHKELHKRKLNKGDE
jgi:hypothetical protein|tara:strand:- start:34663 stop:34824 length:162 start_codon:yes stop_codon:yes gene_type:complete